MRCKRILIKADKNDLKKLSQLVFYSAPMAKKFVEHLRSEAPQPGQAYEVTRDPTYTEEEDILLREDNQDPEEDIYGTKRKREEPDEDDQEAKIARIEGTTFQFEY